VSEPTGGADAPAIWDVVIVGGGNAALVAAMTARHRGCSVLLLERAPRELRGGNTRHTRNLRAAHDRGDDFVTGAYDADELYKDLCGIGSGPGDEALAWLTVEESATVAEWMAAHGVHWQPPLTGTLQLGRTNRFFLGGGKALINTYYRSAATLGVAVAYDACVETIAVDGEVATLATTVAGRAEEIRARAVVCASGGFEANLEWLGRYWGEAAKNYIVRGARFNDGQVLQALYDLGAAPMGEERGFHAVAVDARAPRYDGGLATRLDSIPFGIVVDRNCARFYDEGEDLWPKRYAIWGGNIARVEDQIAFSVWDAKTNLAFLPPMYPVRAVASIEEVATSLGLDPPALRRTVDDYNAAVVPGGRFDPERLDDCRTDGLSPNKTHWAQRIDTPPYRGVAMRPGITFTYRGVAVDARAGVRGANGECIDHVFAAGEIMSGNVLTSGYLAGFGMTIGSVWGRIAGRSAAEHAQRA
jgi:tricarballylate dehydrogenase